MSDHPQVVVPALKEIDFFSYHYEKGTAWYERQLTERSGANQYGEISPSYFHEPGVMPRVQRYADSMRIIVSLRDPVERALSQHRHLVRLGIVDAGDLRVETALPTNPTYVEQGLYYKHLVRWIEAFGARNVHVVLMDDITRDSAAVARSLYCFLGVDEKHRSAALNERSNPSYVVRNQGLEASVHTVRQVLASVGGQRLWRTIGDSGLRDLYRRGNRQASATVIPPPLPETRRHLRQLFRDDTQRLADLIERDLSAWLSE